MSRGFAISFSGRIASGKSHITHELSQLLGWPRTGFSDYLRRVLAEQGINDPSREQLQDLGQSLVATNPEKFCKDVLGLAQYDPGGNVLIDGIRHVDIQRRVARLVQPSQSYLIHLAAPDEIVADRVRARGTSDKELHRAEEHVVEQELRQALPDIADCVIDTSQAPHMALSQCLSALERFGVDSTTILKARTAI